MHIYPFKKHFFGWKQRFNAHFLCDLIRFLNTVMLANKDMQNIFILSGSSIINIYIFDINRELKIIQIYRY